MSYFLWMFELGEEMKIPKKLLHKIELYCILNNVKDENDVPYFCPNCVHCNLDEEFNPPLWGFRCYSESGESRKRMKRFQFSCDMGTYKNFRAGPSFDKGNQDIFQGCEQWRKK